MGIEGEAGREEEANTGRGRREGELYEREGEREGEREREMQFRPTSGVRTRKLAAIVALSVLLKH